MAAIVWNGLDLARSTLPPEVDSELRSTAFKDTRQIFKLIAEAASIQAIFKTAGLEMMVVKGPPLSLQAFGAISMRQCRDIDILVKPADIMKARKLLLAAGYRQNFPENIHDEKELQFWLDLKKDLAFDCPSGTLLELHSRLQRNPHLFDEEALEHQTVRLAPKVAVEALSGDDLLVYLCLHGGTHHWERMKWLADVAALLENDPTRLERLCEYAQTGRAKVAVGLALLLCNRVFETNVPPRTILALRRSWRLRILSRYALARMIDRQIIAEKPFGSTQIQLLALLLRFDARYFFHELMHWLVDWSTVAALGGKRHAVVMSVMLRPFTWGWTAISRLKRKITRSP